MSSTFTTSGGRIIGPNGARLLAIGTYQPSREDTRPIASIFYASMTSRSYDTENTPSHLMAMSAIDLLEVTTASVIPLT